MVLADVVIRFANVRSVRLLSTDCKILLAPPAPHAKIIASHSKFLPSLSLTCLPSSEVTSQVVSINTPISSSAAANRPISPIQPSFDTQNFDLLRDLILGRLLSTPHEDRNLSASKYGLPSCCCLIACLFKAACLTLPVGLIGPQPTTSTLSILTLFITGLTRLSFLHNLKNGPVLSNK